MPFDRELVEARLALNLIPSNEMPKIAWDALEAGLDGPAIRKLAAFEKPTWFQVNEILPHAMREMGLRPIGKREGAVRFAVQRASEILENDLDPLNFIRGFEQLWITTGYEDAIVELGTLEDDLFVAHSMGNTDQAKREWTKERLRRFLAKQSKQT